MSFKSFQNFLNQEQDEFVAEVEVDNVPSDPASVMSQFITRYIQMIIC